jgi:D-arabinose 1-dehydrogenase-like Zn-dependent alcohol dehydrogenase
VPGHEVVGVVDALGADVHQWTVGQRVGVGWNGGNCGYCEACRRGNFFACQTFTAITGITYDGGYAEYMVARAEAVARVPDELSPVDAAPLMCAGVTTFNALRNSGARPGDLVAVLGLGGLGHLAVQYAAKGGYRTVAIARGKDKEKLALELGARHYIDSQAGNPSEALCRLGGARVVLATVTNGDAMAAVVGGLGVDGVLMVIGAAESMTIYPGQFIQGRLAIKGWYSGIALDSQETMEFSVREGIRSMNEVVPLEGVAEGYQRMMSGAARFRVVLQMP